MFLSLLAFPRLIDSGKRSPTGPTTNHLTTGDVNQGLLDRLVADDLPRAMRFALRLTGCHETAEEIVQEVLYRVVRTASSFRGESQFRTWFYRIIISAFRDQLAATARHRCAHELTDQLADPHSEDPSAATMADELRSLIAQRVSALPPRQREVLVLIAYEQVPPREAAKLLGISESNVHANLHYARARLRRNCALSEGIARWTVNRNRSIRSPIPSIASWRRPAGPSRDPKQSPGCTAGGDRSWPTGKRSLPKRAEEG